MTPIPQPVRRLNVRPKFHFSADSWINDPCAPGYDPWTKTYHLFYQCNPTSCEWGNMSWGHIISKDLLTWTTAEISPALVPDQAYDCDGVFTGCWIPLTDTEDKTLRVAYSSVKKLPFHWSTPPYPRDAAGISLATSRDGGKTWEKSTQNPILTGEPGGLHVTGFRDPFVTQSSVLDEALQAFEPGLYGLVSGGIEGSGPTTFLYQISPKNPQSWQYIGPLVDVPSRFQPSKKWSGNYGVNWECTNVVGLKDDTETRHFMIIGAEGDLEKEHVKNFKRLPGAPTRTVRAQVWMSGNFTATGNDIKFLYEYGGYLDHGPYYAANSFMDPESGRRIVYGWIPEEDISSEAANKKGWNGTLAVPREIFLLRIPRVQAALSSKLSDIASVEIKREIDGSDTLFTLGVRPINELARLRQDGEEIKLNSVLVLPQLDGASNPALFKIPSPSWELEANIEVRPGCETVGFHIRHNEDLSIRTTITFSIVSETITVDREASNTESTMNKCPDAGPFTLFTRIEDSRDAEPTLEKIRLRIFSDGDILEIFANDRFALATMVYSEGYGKEFGGVTAFATGAEKSAAFETVTFWDGMDTNMETIT